jgi:hypothetical protein|uniref:DUF3789 domain-containing protein n=1 Tax=Desulfobacca acetoxidans TaxID=60893 RepID=A0A7C3WP69_9BACT
MLAFFLGLMVGALVGVTAMCLLVMGKERPEDAVFDPGLRRKFGL